MQVHLPILLVKYYFIYWIVHIYNVNFKGGEDTEPGEFIFSALLGYEDERLSQRVIGRRRIKGSKRNCLEVYIKSLKLRQPEKCLWLTVLFQRITQSGFVVEPLSIIGTLPQQLTAQNQDSLEDFLSPESDWVFIMCKMIFMETKLINIPK